MLLLVSVIACLCVGQAHSNPPDQVRQQFNFINLMIDTNIETYRIKVSANFGLAHALK